MVRANSLVQMLNQRFVIDRKSETNMPPRARHDTVNERLRTRDPSPCHTYTHTHTHIHTSITTTAPPPPSPPPPPPPSSLPPPITSVHTIAATIPPLCTRSQGHATRTLSRHSRGLSPRAHLRRCRASCGHRQQRRCPPHAPAPALQCSPRTQQNPGACSGPQSSPRPHAPPPHD